VDLTAVGAGFEVVLMIIVKWLEIYERRLMAWGEGKGRDGAFVSMIEARFGTLLVLTESVLT
jgi:hypothetical protein